MPDLEDPAAQGTLMAPEFFLTGQQIPLGSTDADRRNTLADCITQSEWFAAALVNRLWAELVGEGFYEPIDDLGPDRTATAPKALKLLATDFANSGYDLKWLFRTICATEAYERESRPRRVSEGVAFAANVPQPLRGDQLFTAIMTALEVDEPELLARRPRRPQAGPGRYAGGIRGVFNATFGYDPSDQREDIGTSIPQVLAMMNSPQYAMRIRARAPVLGKIIQECGDDEEAIVRRLYLQCLSREPTDEEQTSLLAYTAEVGDRHEAYEDLLWALLNSAEFRYRR